MQTGNLLEKTMPNCRFMTWLWHHHCCNHYSYDVLRVTRSSTNLHLYYFIIKCNLFIKILQCSKKTKNMKFIQNYKFQKFSGASNKIATAGLLRTTEPWRFLRICQIDINWKSQKHNPHQFILSEIFQKVLVGGSFTPPLSPQEEIGLKLCQNESISSRNWNLAKKWYYPQNLQI